MRLRQRTACLLVLLALAATGARAQDLPPDLDRLRRNAELHPDSFPVVFAFARAAARATSERPGEWRDRFDARKLLDRAYRLRPEDPRVLAELGFLLRKQGFRPDAMRMLERAERRAAERGAALSPHDRAELHFQIGLIYEVWWEDGEHLGILPSDFVPGSCPHIYMVYPPGTTVPSSARANLLAYNVVCPGLFDEIMDYWYRPDDQYEADFVRMVRHFRAAVEADPAFPDPALRLLRHLAAARMWEEFLAVAEPLARLQSADPYALLFLGLGYHELGEAERADSAFAAALEHADDALRRDLLEPEQLLRRQDSLSFTGLPAERRATLTDIFWRSRDPLFMSAENERLGEHLARLAYVEVAYSAPQSSLRGRWSERGGAWLRWGRPHQIRAVGEHEFWDYGRGVPDLVFVRYRTYRAAWYEEFSREYMRWAREQRPEFYAPAHPRIVAGVPFQAAVFRDSAGGPVLEVHAALPDSALRGATDLAEIETGIFVVTGDSWELRSARRWRVPSAGAPVAFAATFTLPPGAYVVSAEAVAGDVAGQERQRLDAPHFGDSLALSDLLLVERFGRDTTQVDERTALAPVVSATRVYPVGAPIGALWEIYGLRTDSGGTARYDVRAEVTDETQRAAVARLLRRVFGGGARPNTVAWTASRAPRPDGTVVEHMTFDLPDVRPGAYRLLVTVTDRVAGRSFTAHRAFRLVPP